MFKQIANIYPKKIRENIKFLLRCSDLYINEQKIAGVAFMWCLSLAIAIAFIISVLFFADYFKFTFILLFIVVFILLNLLFYNYLTLIADKKASVIEDVLPDALHLTSTNLNSGMPIHKALLAAARPEFGPLKDELHLAGKAIKLNKPISEALINMTTRIKSKIVERTMRLIVFAEKSGGKLANLLESTAEDLRKERIANDRIRSSTSRYTGIIYITIGIFAPILYAIASHLSKVITDFLAKAEFGEVANIPLKFGAGGGVSPKLIFGFCIISLMLRSFTGGVTIGLIERGKGREGIRYIFPLIVMGLTIYFFVRALIGYVLGGFFI